MKAYIIENKKLYISSLLLASLIILTAFLSNLELSSYGYALFLYTFIIICYSILDYIRYKNTTEGIARYLESVIDIPEEVYFYRKSPLEILHYRGYEIQKEKIENILETASNAEEERGYYLNLWTHQIKTPITAMNLILDGNSKNKTRELKSELKSISIYLDNIINYLKIQGDSVDFVFKKQPLKRIINTLVKNNSILFIYKSLTINIDIEDVDIVTDQKWLKFALEQILLNSIKYTDSGGIEIFNKKGEEGILHIKDTGVGISSDELPRITELGFTGTRGRIDCNATGIGLYLTDSILKYLGYEYKINSKEDEGTEFIINLNRNRIDLV